MLSITRNTVNDRNLNRVDNIVRVIGLWLVPGLQPERCYLHPLCFPSVGHSPDGSKRHAYEPKSAKATASAASVATQTAIAMRWILGRPYMPLVQLG